MGSTPSAPFGLGAQWNTQPSSPGVAIADAQNAQGLSAGGGVWRRKLSSRKQTTAAYLMTQHTAWAPHVTSTRTTGRRLDCYAHARDELYIRANSVEASTSTHEA